MPGAFSRKPGALPETWGRGSEGGRVEGRRQRVWLQKICIINLFFEEDEKSPGPDGPGNHSLIHSFVPVYPTPYIVPVTT